MKNLRFTALLALICVLVSIGSAQAQGFNIEMSTKGGYGEKQLRKAPKKVYIHSFEAYFQTFATGVAKSRARSIGNTRMGATKTSMLVALDGVKAADLQQVTDEVYQAFIAELEAMGYEIISAEEAAKMSSLLSEYTLREGGTINTAQLEGYARVSPTGYNFLVPKVKASGKEKSTFIDRSQKYSKELDDAIVVNASFAFPFIDIGAANTFMPGKSKVKAETAFRLAHTVAEAADKKSTLGYTPNPATANTRVNFTYGKGAGATARAFLTNTPKKDLTLNGIVDPKKFKETTYSDNVNLGAYAWYQTVSVSNIDAKVTHVIETSAEEYKAAIQGAMSSFMNNAMAEFKAVAK